MKNLVKNFTIMVLAVSFMVGISGSVFAQGYNTPAANPPYNAPAYNPPVYNPPANNPAYTFDDRAFRARKIIGTEVKDMRGEKLGKIEDLLLDPAQPGRVAFAVLDPAWGLGFGHDRMVAIPMSALSWNQADHSLVLNFPRERLAQAPSFNDDHWPNMADRNWVASTYRFFGVNPYWTVGP